MLVFLYFFLIFSVQLKGLTSFLYYVKFHWICIGLVLFYSYIYSYVRQKKIHKTTFLNILNDVLSSSVLYYVQFYM